MPNERQGGTHFFFHQVQAVAAIAAKALVAAVAGKGDGDVLARQLADPVGGDGGAVGVGFVIEPGQRVDEVEVVALDDVEEVIGAVAVGHHLGECRFVEGRVGKADGAGVDRGIRQAGHDGDHGTGIDAAGKEGAKRHFGNHPQADGFFQAVREFGAGVALADRVVEGEADIPVWSWFAERLATADKQGVRGREFPGALENGARFGNVAEGKIFFDGTGIDFALEAPMREQ